MTLNSLRDIPVFLLKVIQGHIVAGHQKNSPIYTKITGYIVQSSLHRTVVVTIHDTSAFLVQGPFLFSNAYIANVNTA